jgi:CheY-like chemotaxis protein
MSMLPGVSGVSGLADLRKALDDGTVGGPAIVAMSGQALGPDPAAYRAAGFDDYLPKPVMLDALRSGLERWIADNP